MCSWLKAPVPLAAALIVLSAGAASAQDQLTVKVPFAFEVRGRTCELPTPMGARP